MQVTDTVRAVHTSGLHRRAFFATVLSVQPALPGDIGTNGEPTVTLGFLDPAQLGMVGGVDWHKAFKRITTVRHVSHDEVQSCATEYCWTDLLPRDGGPFALEGLNMSRVDNPPAEAAATEETEIGSIVYINHNNGLEVFKWAADKFRVHFDDEDFDFTDLFSAKVFVDAKPAEALNRINGSPRELVEVESHGTNSEAVARQRYEASKQLDPLFTGIFDRGETQGEGRYVAVSQGVSLDNFATWDEARMFLAKYRAGLAPPKPSAADLDAVADEQKSVDATIKGLDGAAKAAEDAAKNEAAGGQS